MKWYQTPKITRWAWQTWRYYSWRPGYDLHLNPQEQTAYVDMQRKLVVCNPTYPYPPEPQRRAVRHLPADEHAFQLQYLEGLIAHEAGHTHFSGQLPGGLLGQLVNIIEDQRMEWLMREDFPNLGALFELAADADAAHAIHQGGLGGDLLRGCLLHRWVHDHPTWRFQPAPAQADLWQEVRIILEEAWRAGTYDQVVRAARQILGMLNLPERQPPRPDLQLMLDGGGQLLLDKLPGTPQPGRQGRGEPQTSVGQLKTPRPSAGRQEQETGSASGEETPGQTAGGKDAAGFEAPDEVQAGSQGVSELPQRPDVEPACTPAAERLRTLTEGEARKLARILNPAGRPAQRQYTRDRGTYRYDRELHGQERAFERQVGERSPGKVHLRLAVDVSYSMEQDGRIKVAREVAFALAYGAQKAGIPMLAYAFDHRSVELFSPRSTSAGALNAVAGIQALGDTLLFPTLQALWSETLPGLSITLIITDGELSTADNQACAQLRASHRGVIVPILLGTKESTRQNYQNTFGRAVLLTQCRDLSAHVAAFLRASLRRLG